MRGATWRHSCGVCAMPFQSTLLMRGATVAGAQPLLTNIFQSTLLMRGATIMILRKRAKRSISIHAPHARSDSPSPRARVGTTTFQSTLLMRGATMRRRRPSNSRSLFQSTLLMRGATRISASTFSRCPISIHAPHARSDWSRCAWMKRLPRFQSTLLMRGATRESRASMPYRNFNPRSSCEERRKEEISWLM